MTNYVSQHDGRILVLTYQPKTEVTAADLDTTCVRSACATLTKETGTIHVPADRDQSAWSRTINKARS